MIPRSSFSWPIWIIPIAVVIWGFAVYSFSIPFYDINPDPEYPYLINGMNVALGNYANIGHLDHPGTPFQIYCGLVIKITHLITGEGTIASDVLGNRPEYYLKAIQASLVILQALIAFFIGRAAEKRRINKVFILILQSSVILLPWLFLRVNQERWLMTCSMLFTLVYIAYGLRDRRPRRFAVWSGIIMAMAVATKFNYLPVLLLPFLLVDTLRNKLIYLGVLAGGYFLFILPVLDNFHYHIDFITGIASHDGKYGGGEERMFNFEVMRENFKLIFSENPEIPILISFLLALFVGSFLDKNQRIFTRKSMLYFGGILIIAAQLLIVAKHYAPNYLIPLVCVYPILLFVLYAHSEGITGHGKFLFLYQLAGVLFILFGLSKVDEWSEYQQIVEDRAVVREDIDRLVPENATWIMTQPLWMRAPYVESGLCYAVSYCFDPRKYFGNLVKMNPNVYVLNSIETTMERWRVEPTLREELILAEDPLYMYSTWMHNAQRNFEFLNETASAMGVELSLDTVYSSPDFSEHILTIAKADISSEEESK